eukprot:Nitzschia sp. Nitz4//scaffold38_size140716//107989//108531//NITZ4_003160-RA/size140716-processed-gene-0.63-mRNA-1//-1//CDS//3329550117//7097//frame0
MGVVIALQAAQDDTIYPDDAKEKGSVTKESLFLMALDDGTGVARIWVSSTMVETMAIQEGLLIDCAARLRQRGETKNWYAVRLTLVQDPHMEILRWMQIARPAEAKETESLCYGYPTVQQNASEALRLINVSTGLNRTGVNLQDLAIVMQKPIAEMQDIVHELQLVGHIYQNHDGCYVPL